MGMLIRALVYTSGVRTTGIVPARVRYVSCRG